MAKKFELEWVVVEAPRAAPAAKGPGGLALGSKLKPAAKEEFVLAGRKPSNLDDWSKGIDSYARSVAERGADKKVRGTAELKMTAQKMTPDDARKTLEQSSNILGLAPKMPFTLIKLSAPGTKGKAPAVSWGIDAVGARKSSCTGAGVTVAVLDTGIDLTHPAFKGSKVDILTDNFTADKSGVDLDGHGTHCAGTIFGADVGGKRIGIARGVSKALIGKVIGSDGGSTESIVKAIQWAQLHGADIISMSLGMDFPLYRQSLVDDGVPDLQATSMALAGYRLNIQLFEKLAVAMTGVKGLTGGSVVTAASGNESMQPTYSILVAPPAAADGIVSVAAVAQKANGYELASFSNVGTKIAAPGVGIWSAAKGGGLVAMDGTSMATPHVAGVAALWWEHCVSEYGEGNFTAETVVDKMQASCKSLAPKINRRNVEWGLVQAPQ